MNVRAPFCGSYATFLALFMRQYIPSIFCLSFLSCVLFAGCSGSERPISTDNRVIEWELSDADALNPYNATSANALDVYEQIFQRLLTIDVHTMQYTVPILATSMPVESPDHLQYDFTLRKDIKWADGTPFTGANVIFSLKALKNPFNTMSAQNRIVVDAIHSAELIDGDPYRVRFTLWKPYFLVMQATFGDGLYILPKHIFDPTGLTDKYSWNDLAALIEASGDQPADSATLAAHKNPAMIEFATWFTDAARNRDPKYIQGTGPYKLESWVTGQYTRLVRNPYYVNHWGP